MQPYEHNLKFVVVEGNIGAGKTSFSARVSEDFNASLILEKFADNPFLPKFYEDQDKYAFQLETSFLIDRYDQLKKQLQAPDLFSNFVVSDYFFSKSLIFAKHTLKLDEFNLYRKIFDLIYKTVPKPDLYVYFHLPIKKLLENISKRGRDYEKNISAEYLEKVQNAYFSYFKEQTDFSFLVINTENLDFVAEKSDYELLLELIFNHQYPKGVTTITPQKTIE
ncbi:MAG: deoxynucleoside kinase [Bacteroidales bacterium]|nr:deoxynucleoside kinase [Bacteroidales bacterium]